MKSKKIIKKLEKICNTNNCESCPFGIMYEWYDGYSLECLFSVPIAPAYYKETIKKNKKYINKIRKDKSC